MLRSFHTVRQRKVLTGCFAASKYQLRCGMSTIPRSSDDMLDFSSTPPQANRFDPKKLYETHFASRGSSNPYEVPYGGFMEISAADIAKYIPEGLAGEIASGSDPKKGVQWMMRDTGRVLCSLVDQFDTEVKQDDITHKYLHQRVDVPGLTDRREWMDAITTATVYGRNMLPVSAMHGAAPKTVVGKGTHVTKRKNRELLAATASLVGVQGADPSPSLLSTFGRGSIVGTILDNIKADEDGKSAQKILLAGSHGTGKSVALNQIVLHARKHGWLCLFIPKGWDQVQSGYYIEPMNEFIADKAKPEYQGVFNNPFMTTAVLRGFWHAHRSDLAKIPVLDKEKIMGKFKDFLGSFNEKWNRAATVALGGSVTIGGAGESATVSTGVQERLGVSFLEMRSMIDDTAALPMNLDLLDDPILGKKSGFDYEKFQLETLEDLVVFGIAFRDLSGLVFMDLVDILKEMDQRKVLIAVDQYNTWEAPSAFYFEGAQVMGKQLCVPHALQFLSKRKDHETSDPMRQLKNGLFICATSFRHNEGRKETFEGVNSSLPLVVRAANYNRVEFLSAVCYGVFSGAIQRFISLQEVLAYRMFVGSNPRSTTTEATNFFFPRAMDQLEYRFRALGQGIYNDSMNDFLHDVNLVPLGYDSPSGSSSSSAAGGSSKNMPPRRPPRASSSATATPNSEPVIAAADADAAAVAQKDSDGREFVTGSSGRVWLKNVQLSLDNTAATDGDADEMDSIIDSFVGDEPR